MRKRLGLLSLLFSFTIILNAQTPELVLDANPDLQPVGLSEVDGQLFFFAWENGGWQPWQSDGSEAGTQRISLLSGSGGGDGYYSLNGIGYFAVNDASSGRELWRTDGTDAGTYLVKDINPGSANGLGFGPYIAFDGRLYFPADDGTHGIELWATDGTAAGTVMVKDLEPGSNSSLPRQFAATQDALYFIANGGYDWGTITDNDKFIYKSDGTAAGTFIVNAATRSEGYRDAEQMAALNDIVYFTAEKLDFQSGFNLWRTDGTVGGTYEVKDIFPNSSGASINATSILLPSGNQLFFIADDGTHGSELWVSDGTEAGTRMVKEVNPGISSFGMRVMASTDSHLFFTRLENNNWQLWASDGTAAGTVELLGAHNAALTSNAALPYMTSVGNKLYFSGKTAGSDVAIWESDGTAAGTAVLADIDGALSGNTIPAAYTYVDGTLFFSGSDGMHGLELWKIGLLTGLAEPTLAVEADIYPNPTRGMMVVELFISRGQLRIYNSIGEPVHRRALSQGQQMVNLSALPAGLYIAGIYDDRGRLAYRSLFMKQ